MEKRYLPDYDGGSILNLMASIAARFGHNTGHSQLRQLPAGMLKPYKKVILLVVDGLGYSYLLKNGSGSRLKENLCGRMTSAFPSTTASGITTFATGQPPSRHAITGWFVHLKELGVVSKILFCEPRLGGEKFSQAGIDVKDMLGSGPIADKLKTKSYVVTPGFIARGPFSSATRGRAVPLPYEELSGLFAMMRKALKRVEAESFIYAYWPEFDHLCHVHGVNSSKVKAHFRELDERISTFGHSVRGDDVLLLVTADHGLVDTPRTKTIYLEDHPGLEQCLSLPLCGEPRVAYCYVHPEKVLRFKRYIGDKLKGKCRLYSRDQILSLGFYGPGPFTSRLADRIGDFVLVMEDGFCLKDFLMGEERFYLKANHGGTTFQEMMVPLIRF